MHYFKTVFQLIPKPVRQKRHELQNWVKMLYFLLRNGIHDTYRVARYTSSLKSKGSQENQRARLTLYYHRIEKAMALPQPRAGFGQQWIKEEFIPLLREYHAHYGCDDVVGSCCLNLRAYVDFNRLLNIQLPAVFENIELTLRDVKKLQSHIVGGVKPITSAEIKAASSIDFVRFAYARHSIRNFSSEAVSKNLVEKAIAIAQRTPSVCNRQPWHVYGFSEKQAISDALKFQNGNNGFAENIQVLLVIAGDLSAMMSSAERNEIWVDGGMYSMSLVYALHALGLGTCCLNLCHNASEENGLRAMVNMVPHHSPIMMIAVGHIPDTLYVAHSQRRLIQEMFAWK